MAITKLKVTQNTFLESYLRGTGNTLTSEQARKTYGIKSLSSRCSELRGVGLRVNTTVTPTGATAYSIAARDVTGSKAKRLA